MSNVNGHRCAGQGGDRWRLEEISGRLDRRNAVGSLATRFYMGWILVRGKLSTPPVGLHCSAAVLAIHQDTIVSYCLPRDNVAKKSKCEVKAKTNDF